MLHFIYELLLFLCACPFMGIGYGFCCCGGLDCSACNGGTTHSSYQIDIAIVTNGSCSNCSVYNGTFILAQNPSGVCTFFYNFPSLHCGTTNDGFRLTFTNFGPLVEIVLDGVATGFLRWTNFQSHPYDCGAYSATSIAFLSSAGVCNGASATCLLTAL
jgi:hypothetical protein